MRWPHIAPITALAVITFASCETSEHPASPKTTDATATVSQYTNLQVLPPDIREDELSELMLDCLSGLGLPRRAGRGCLHCHEGSLETPRATWNYASDAKPAKAQARAMIRMVRDINERHLNNVKPRVDSSSRVNCYTCHKGRLNPQPLDQLLLDRYNDDGLQGLTKTYRELHRRFFAADAYDFRMRTLSGIGTALASRGAFDDAAAVHTLNHEYHDDPQALSGVIAVRLEQALKASDIDGMVARYHALKTELPKEAFRPLLLDGVGWRIFRAGLRDAGFRLFELNYEEHPDNFTATEDLAWGCLDMGQKARAVKLAEAWFAAHPDHEAGRLMRNEIVRRARQQPAREGR